MAKHGFLDVLEAALDKHFTYDYELNWDKKNHAVELAFILEAQNTAGIETVDDEGNASAEDIFLEEYVPPVDSGISSDTYVNNRAKRS